MRIAGLVPFALLALAGCHREAKLSADQAWVRLPAVAGHPGAGYLTIHGGPEAERLLAVESPAAGSTELHESMKMGPGGMTGMQRLDGLDVSANGTVAFAPGGNHVMMFGLSPSLRPGGTVPFSVRFAKGPPLTVEAKVVGAGDAAPY
ncbi:copper chaperone PCu(A)C [Sphingomonas sp. CGMCC 1.13654]|uniref:Copper chaperone PCu(A)C n=1 Tax=Sphingomonas chungangi TaxID=2683589 RepID=A0A838LAJ6_9SPHN|nr:copper chaperone PCu(A)C [Sphingomonas chungangi]MBA2936047.1 copper chaperone PCu(A)C [Sphingomonas chungangi]MVW55436.1 copper chaperone PCu(A)C [Sphingomonas chungangi]